MAQTSIRNYHWNDRDPNHYDRLETQLASGEWTLVLVIKHEIESHEARTAVEKGYSVLAGRGQYRIKRRSIYFIKE